MERIFSVLDFGAVPNTEDLQTAALQAAVDACFAAGGGEVQVPPGTYRTATVRLRSRVTLHLLSGAVLMGSTNPRDYDIFLDDTVEPITVKECEPNFGDRPLFHAGGVYPAADENTKVTFTGNHPVTNVWYNALLRAYMAEDIRVIGEPGSYIDGQNCYDPYGEENYRGPHGINFFRCKNIEFSGYTLKDTGNWAHILFECQNIFAHDLTVLGGHDGIHCRSCDNVVIEDCELYTGDDCIAGYDNQNMLIRRCLMDGACSAMRLGGTDILVDACHTRGPARYGFRGSLSPEEKAERADTNETHRHNQLCAFLYFCNLPTAIRKTPGNILVQNCEFENPDSFFRLWFDGKHKWCENKSLSSITFRHCKAWGVSAPMDILCPKDEPITMRLEDVEICVAEGHENRTAINALNFAELVLDNVRFVGYTNPTVRVQNPGKLIVRDSTPVAVVPTEF